MMSIIAGLSLLLAAMVTSIVKPTCYTIKLLSNCVFRLAHFWGLRLFSNENSEILLPYAYRSLETGSHIRILELIPAEVASPRLPQCRIHHMDLDDPNLKFTAVSYAWGDISLPSRKPVYVDDGSVVLVSPNLRSFLCRLQSQTSVVFVWADAICINQGEDEVALQERSAQVQMMRRIYSEAEEVLVDLGDVPADDGILVEGFNQLAAHDKEKWNTVMSEAEDKFSKIPDFALGLPSKQRRKYYIDFEALLSSLDAPRPGHSFWGVVERFLRRPWFRRIWVVQEMAVGKQLRFYVGPHLLSEAVFRKATKRALDYRLLEMHLYLDMKSRVGTIMATLSANFTILKILVKAIWNMEFKGIPQDAEAQWTHDRWKRHNTVRSDLFVTRKAAMLRFREKHTWKLITEAEWFNERNPLSLQKLFFTYRQYQCSDPRDRLYGLLGLSDESSDPDLYVDYTEGWQQVSVRLTRYFIGQDLGPVSLYLASHSVQGQPSWAISLKAMDQDTSLLEMLMIYEKGLANEGSSASFRAAGRTIFSSTFSTRNALEMVTRGVLLGPILTQVSACPIEASHDPVSAYYHLFDWGIDVARWMHKNASMPDVMLTEEDFRFKCFRTLLLDLRHDANGQLQRLGNGPEAISLLMALESYFIHFPSDWELKKYALFHYLDLAKRADGFRNLRKDAMRSIPGRRLGLAFKMDGHVSLSGEIQTPAKEPWTPAAFLCQLPAESDIWDEIAVINGCHVPFVLRKDSDSKSYRIIGCCYVDGMMDGEVLRLDQDRWPQQEIILS